MSFVYIMTNSGNSKIIKVGYSLDPDKRAKELNYTRYGNNYGCLNWYVASKYKSKSGLTAQKLEYKAHTLLSDYRIKANAHSDNELFACPVELAKSILSKEKTIQPKCTSYNKQPHNTDDILNRHRYKGQTQRPKSTINRSTNYALGTLFCPNTGDEYYYANQKRFNVNTKITEKVTIEEWREAEKGYCKPSKKGLFQFIKKYLR